jgi:hypothetical protein
MNMTYNAGMYTSDVQDALRKDIISEMVWLKTLNQIEFMDAVEQETTDVLDKHLRFPKDNTLGAFQINEGGSTIAQKIGWFEKSFSLNKYRSKLMIDDEAKVRLDEATQWQYSIDGVAKGMAQAHDYDILNALYNGAGIEQAAATYWSSMGSDLVGDIANMLGKVFEKESTNVTEAEINSIVVYYPLKLWGHIRTPEMLMQPTAGATAHQGRLMVDTSQYGWAGGEYGLTFRGSAKLNSLNCALAVIKSPFTAKHFTYTGGAIPTVEQTRDAEEGADTYFITQYFSSLVVPQSYSQQSTNDRILKVTGVSQSS